MTSNPCIGIIGGDMRQVYVANYLAELGYPICVYSLCDEICVPGYHANSLAEVLNKCQVIVGPIPFSSKQNIVSKNTAAHDLCISTFLEYLKCGHIIFGGVIPSSITNYCDDQNITYFDFMSISRIAILNTIATAEGTIMEAIQKSIINLHGSNCLVLGFGKCANTLASKLYGLSANVTIAARSTDAIACAISYGYNAIPLIDLPEHLCEFHYIFNTIPAMVLPSSLLALVDKNVTIIDIASAPGGIDFEYAKQNDINAHLCLSLPGKVAPKTSAIYLVNEIISLLNERSE